MGFFGRFAYSGGQWVGEQPTGTPSLTIEIHDSDIAAVEYVPAVGTGGSFYLGIEPRVYFEDDALGDPVDTAAQARGFAEWVRQVQGREVDPAAVEALMAIADADEEPKDDFVEETVAKLLDLAGIPLPEALAMTDEGDDD